MANEEHLALLKQGVAVWNEWRESNDDILIDLSRTKLNVSNLREVDLFRANLFETDIRGTDFFKATLFKADLRKANLLKTNLIRTDLRKADLGEANLTEASLVKAYLAEADLSGADLSGADIRKANLIGANLTGANLTRANLNEANLSKANLSEVKLIETQALATKFEKATITGACLEDWNINNLTNLDSVICDYVYLKMGQKERCPSAGIFAPGDFTRRFRKVLDTVDLIFRNGVNWIAFAYSFKVESEKEGISLKVKSIEEIDDSLILVKVQVPPYADKAKVQNNLEQEYKSLLNALEEKHQGQIRGKEEQINQLFAIINQQFSVQMKMADNFKEVPKFYLPNAQITGGLADTNQAYMVGGDIQNYPQQQKLSEAAIEIQQLITQLQTQGYSPEAAQQKVARDFASQAKNNPTTKNKLIRWGQYLGDAAANGVIGDVAVEVIKLALGFAGIGV